MVLWGADGARLLGLLGGWVILDLVMWRSGVSAGVEAVDASRAAEVLWRVRREMAVENVVRLAKVRAKVQLGQAMVGWLSVCRWLSSRMCEVARRDVEARKSAVLNQLLVQSSINIQPCRTSAAVFPKRQLHHHLTAITTALLLHPPTDHQQWPPPQPQHHSAAPPADWQQTSSRRKSSGHYSRSSHRPMVNQSNSISPSSNAPNSTAKSSPQSSHRNSATEETPREKSFEIWSPAHNSPCHSPKYLPSPTTPQQLHEH